MPPPGPRPGPPTSPLSPAERMRLVTDHLFLLPILARTLQGAWQSRVPTEELEQEAFLGLARAAESFDPAQHRRGVDGFRGYAWGTTMTRLKRYVWRQCRLSRGRSDAGAGVAVLPEQRLDLGPEPAEIVAGRELWALALRPLDPRGRELLTLILREGWTFREVAESWGVKHQRIQQLYRRALRRVAKELAELAPGSEVRGQRSEGRGQRQRRSEGRSLNASRRSPSRWNQRPQLSPPDPAASADQVVPPGDPVG